MSDIHTFEIFIGLCTLGLTTSFQFIGPGSGTTILNRGFKLNNSTTLKSSLFTMYDKVSADFAQVLGLFPHKTFKNCDSFIECAFLCHGEKSCEFFHYHESTKGCITLDTSMADVRDDGIYVCVPPFRIYGNAKFKFCQNLVSNLRTRIQAQTLCSNIRGRLAVLIEDLEHTTAAFTAQKAYIGTDKAVWIDAMMNTADKRWYWPDGTLVPESRFNHASIDFQNRYTSKPCVAFLGTKYVLKSCALEKAYVLCEADLTRL